MSPLLFFSPFAGEMVQVLLRQSQQILQNNDQMRKELDEMKKAVGKLVPGKSSAGANAVEEKKAIVRFISFCLPFSRRYIILLHFKLCHNLNSFCFPLYSFVAEG
jgi:hypothetical protein